MSKRDTSPVSPPLAASKNSTIAFCAKFDALRNGKTRLSALSKRLNSSHSRHLGISNGVNRLRI